VGRDTNHRADGELVDRCIGGDRDAWDRFVDRFSGLVYFSICHVLRTRGANVPQDLVGEVHNTVFLSLLEDDFRRLRRFSGRCKLSHWIKVVTVNRTIDMLRKQRPHVPLDEADGEGHRGLHALVAERADPEEQAMRSERMRYLGRAVAKLSPPDQVLLRLIYIEGEPGEAVARALGTTVGAVYTRKNRLRKRLAKLLRPGRNGAAASKSVGRGLASPPRTSSSRGTG